MRESKAYSDQEALDLHLVDIVAKTIRFADDNERADDYALRRHQQTLHLGTPVVSCQPTIRENILDHLMQPNLALLILMLAGC